MNTAALPQPNLKAVALGYAEQGWPVFPVVPGEKRPLTPRGFHDASMDPAKIEAWWHQHPTANIGIPTGHTSGLFVVDIDRKPGTDGLASLANLPSLPPTRTALTANGGEHRVFRMPPEGLRNSTGKVAPGIDTRGAGGYIVAAGSRLANGREYQWVNAEAVIAELPEVWLELLTAKPARGPKLVPDTVPSGRRNFELFSLAASLRGKGCSAEEILALLEVTNRTRCSPPVDDTELAGIASGVLRYEPTRTYPLTEFGLSERLEDDLKGSVAWCSALGDLVFDGRCWAPDHAMTIQQRAQRVIHDLAAEAAALPPDPPVMVEAGTGGRRPAPGPKAVLTKFAQASQRAGKVKAMGELLRPRIAIDIEEFDRDPHLLNVQNGTLNLQSGELRPHNPADRFLKIAGTTYDINAGCPKFLEFLAQIMAGDAEMTGYLQCVFGSALLGTNEKQELIIFYGTGANGKSSLLTVIREAMGLYAKPVSADILTERKDNSIPNDLAGLAGARLVIASETRDGKRLNTAQIKNMLGGEPVSARFLHKEWFEFKPNFRIILGTNHKPLFDGSDYGIVRRIQLVPFEVRIPPQQVDPDLGVKLREELPGILAWLVEGCRHYREVGLNPPRKVLEQTAEYGKEMNTLGLFLGEKTRECIYANVSADALYAAYYQWCLTDSLRPLSKVHFGRKVVEHFAHSSSVKNIKAGGLKVWNGLELASQTTPVSLRLAS